MDSVELIKQSLNFAQIYLVRFLTEAYQRDSIWIFCFLLSVFIRTDFGKRFPFILFI